MKTFRKDLAEKLKDPEFRKAWERERAIEKAVNNFTIMIGFMNDEDRKECFDKVFGFFCQWCGSAKLPCYCMRDD